MIHFASLTQRKPSQLAPRTSSLAFGVLRERAAFAQVRIELVSKKSDGYVQHHAPPVFGCSFSV